MHDLNKAVAGKCVGDVQNAESIFPAKRGVTKYRWAFVDQYARPSLSNDSALADWALQSWPDFVFCRRARGLSVNALILALWFFRQKWCDQTATHHNQSDQ